MTHQNVATLLKRGTVLYHEADDMVKPLKQTDILVEGNVIVKIGTDLVAPPGAETIDCTDKIISPGFVDTHHHLWQTQLKGRHAHDSLLDYFSNGYLACHHYEPEDSYWGQLAGAVEAINAGTTFVVDHAHGCKTTDHGDGRIEIIAHQALTATIESGIRSIFAYGNPTRLERWDHDCCIPSQDLLPADILDDVEALAGQQPFGNDRVHIGFGFDYYFLPREIVVGLFNRLRQAGVKLFTSHVVKTGIFALGSIVNTLVEYGLIISPPDILLSHCTGLNDQEKAILRDTGIPISTTPDTESRMAMGWSLSFSPGINYTFGVDCHTATTASIPQQCRVAIGMARQERTLPLTNTGRFPSSMPATVEQAFNAATIAGARAVGLGDRIGSIQEGKLADLVIFDATRVNMAVVSEFDPLVAVINHSDAGDVQGVMIDGVWRKRNGQLTAVQAEHGQVHTWEQVRKHLIRSQRRIREKETMVNMAMGRDLVSKIYYVDESKLADPL